MVLQKLKRSFNKLPSAWLLFTLLGMLMCVPWYNDSVQSHAITWMLSTVALLLIAKLIQRSPIETGIGFALVGLSVIASAFVAIGNWVAIAPYANFIEAAAYFYGAAGLLAYMFNDRFLTLDELFAAAAAFVVLCWGFAFAYSACQSWYPDSFNMANDAQTARSWLELLFLSFSVQSGTGLSDIYPLGAPARVLVIVQMFAQVMYLALVVSRLVSLTPFSQRINTDD